MLEKVFNPSEIDPKWRKNWSETNAFTADSNSDADPYTIILPPPNVTGTLTIGHVLGTTVQDILVRWKRLKGYNVLWLSGTDHAGIATQKVVENNLLREGIDKESLGREKFLEKCWQWKDKCHGRIVEQLNKLGASLDWTRERFTLDEGVSEAVREVFVRLYEKGFIYRDNYIVNWCPSCMTAISNEEVEFKDTDGKLYYIAYPFEGSDEEIVIGTTRPETMLGDVAVAVNPDDIKRTQYEGKSLILPLAGRKIPIIFDEAVDPEFGTGCLKVTPAHDPTDFEIGRRHDLDDVVVIGRDGKMTEEAGEFKGLDRYDARKKVLKALDNKGFLRRIEDYNHSVGYHDRCGTVIEPAISKQWFMKMDTLAKPAIETVRNGDVSFLPPRWKNIYLSWMEEIRDWCISRQLWWGHRIPVWYCMKCDKAVVSVSTPSECSFCGSSELVQDPDVLDTWFSSWLWTFSTLGWPGKTDDLKTFHPTDVLVTGGDIIFFWVARMIMASMEFMGEPPFSTVYITGIVRDMNGRKMSKSLGNSPDPIDIIDRYGADSLRFALMRLSPPGQDIMFDEKKVEVGKHFANKVWNAARFVLSQSDTLGYKFESGKDLGEVSEGADGNAIISLFKSIFGFTPDLDCQFNLEDKWIASRLAGMLDDYERYIDSFRFDEAIKTFYDFFWHEFCDWYMEFSKPILSEEKSKAAGVLVTSRAVLGACVIALNPVMPFITEEIWSMLAPDSESLSQYKFDDASGDLKDVKLENDIKILMEVITGIRNLKHTFNVSSSKDVKVIVNCKPESSLKEMLSPFVKQIQRQAEIAEVDIRKGASKPPKCAASGHSSFEIYMPLEKIVDLEGEKKKLDKDIDKLESQIDVIEKRLNNEHFLKKAPEEVVSRERERIRDMKDRGKRMKAILEDLD
ncbi:MAG: valine--tRNA ligase [Candidatus Krumholzibacteriota bacterium]|nr:valine--tRNA ligase [Candidatus Krumholzibacteriota bacterium]